MGGGGGGGGEVKGEWRGFEKPWLCGQCESPQIHSTIMISLHNMVMPLCVSNVVFSFWGGGSLNTQIRLTSHNAVGLGNTVAVP